MTIFKRKKLEKRKRNKRNTAFVTNEVVFRAFNNVHSGLQYRKLSDRLMNFCFVIIYSMPRLVVALKLI